MPEPKPASNPSNRPAGPQPDPAQNQPGRTPIPNTGTPPAGQKPDEHPGIQPERSSRVVNRVIDRLNRL